MEQRTNIDILYYIALDRLNAQIKRMDGIDVKIGVTFGLANGVIAALVAFAAFLTHPVSRLVLVFATLSAVAYIITLILLFFAYRWGKWSFKPNLERLRKICTSHKYRGYPDIVKEWIAEECIRSFGSNRQPLLNKVNLANLALISLSAQGLLLTASFISYLYN